MTGKTVGQYRQLLQHVKAHARRFTGSNFSPDKEVCDFEKALQSAVKTEYAAVTSTFVKVFGEGFLI